MCNTDIFLDVGAGGLAYMVIEFARSGVTSIGIDISPKAMITAHKLARQTLYDHISKKYHFVVASATHIPIRTSYIDKVVSIAVLEHVPDDDLAILDMSRTLKRGAKAFVTVPNKRNLWEKLPGFRDLYRQHDQKVGHLRHYKVEEIIDKFNGAGFVVKRIIYHAHLPRIVSFIVEKLLGNGNRIADTLWCRLERLDEQLSMLPSGMHVSIVFEKIFTDGCKKSPLSEGRT